MTNWNSSVGCRERGGGRGGEAAEWHMKKKNEGIPNKNKGKRRGTHQKGVSGLRTGED